MKMFVKHSFFVILSLISFISVFYSAGKFMMFLSLPQKVPQNFSNDSTIVSLLIDMALLSTFMLQHSLMVVAPFRQFLLNVGLNVVSRSIYNLITSVLLLVIVKYWRVTSEIVFWNFDVGITTTLWYIFSIIHLFAWSVIYTGCLFMDIPEILGVKQVYYNIRKMPSPMLFKSSELQRLYGHTRHPSLSSFLIIFWIYPVMSFDRFLLASVLTAYMYIAWKTDRSDYYYQRNQYFLKTQELSKLH